MKLRFDKMEGTGNDFILIDNLEGLYDDTDWGKPVIRLCRRKLGIGADGVLILEKERGSDFRMRIFNPDGQEVEMCGNGARCSAFYWCLKEKKESVRFNTLAGIMSAEIGKGNMVRLSLTPPADARLDLLIKIENKEMSVSFINTGVPHVVVESEKIDSIDVDRLGRGIRYNEVFAPHGTNANFVQVTGEKSLYVRTYERGVEEETLACGTGVVASAVIESLKGKVSPPVTVKTKGGETMNVYFKQSKEDDLISRIYDVKLEGGVNRVFSGEVEL
ncbi:MAG: diaminopimelate epimerase [Elusimicrobia bacterium]|nr:diaminopimelate epimerase [Elusimicrobiota bacterium]